MKRSLIRLFLLSIFFVSVTTEVSAQKTKKRSAVKRTKTNNNATAAPAVKVDTVAVVTAAPEKIDSLPIAKVKKSLRPDETVETKDIRDRIPLVYEHIRADDAVYRHKIWREIDAREKINLPFRYSADENNGNQRFISILLKAIQNGDVTAFSNI